MPGRIPPTSQLDWLISTTAMIVLFWSRATRDLLRSFGWGIAALHRLQAATKLPPPRRPPHRIYWSRHGETPLGRAMWFPRTAPPARRGADPERDEEFESISLQQTVWSLAGIRLSPSRSRAFPPVLRAGAASAVVRDGHDAAIWRQRAIISLSGPIPVPQRQ